MKHPVIRCAAGVIMAVLAGGSVWADDWPCVHSVAPKGVIFIPNSDKDGLKDFSGGIGTGAEVMFTILRSPYVNLQVGPELEFIGLSTYKYSAPTYSGRQMEIGVMFNALKEKGNIAAVFPLGPVSLYLGGGIVLNYVISFGYTRNNINGPDTDTTITGAGFGLQALGGINIRAGRRGSVALGVTLPIAQNQDVEYITYDHNTNQRLASGTFRMNVGVTELYAGYRINFALPYSTPEPVPGPEGQAPAPPPPPAQGQGQPGQ